MVLAQLCASNWLIPASLRKTALFCRHRYTNPLCFPEPTMDEAEIRSDSELFSCKEKTLSGVRKTCFSTHTRDLLGLSLSPSEAASEEEDSQKFFLFFFIFFFLGAGSILSSSHSVLDTGVRELHIRPVVTPLVCRCLRRSM